MAEIISISLNKQVLKDMNFLQEKVGFSGRSEIVRSGVRNLIEEYKTLDNLNEEIEGVIIVIHKEEFTNEFAKLKHETHSLVKTHIHHEIKNHHCMEILLFNGKGEKVKNFYNKLKSSKKISSVKLILS